MWSIRRINTLFLMQKRILRATAWSTTYRNAIFSWRSALASGTRAKVVHLWPDWSLVGYPRWNWGRKQSGNETKREWQDFSEWQDTNHDFQTGHNHQLSKSVCNVASGRYHFHRHATGRRHGAIPASTFKYRWWHYFIYRTSWRAKIARTRCHLIQIIQ